MLDIPVFTLATGNGVLCGLAVLLVVVPSIILPCAARHRRLYTTNPLITGGFSWKHYKNHTENYFRIWGLKIPD
jgi:hypothetical protein